MIFIVPDPADAQTQWSEFYPLVVRHAERVPYPIAIESVIEAAREFFRVSLAWRSVRKMALATTVSGQEVYDVDIPAGVELHRLIAVWYGDKEIGVELPDEVDDSYPDETDSDWVAGVESPDEMRLTPTPNASGIELKGTAAYIPTTISSGLPELLFRRWKNAIAHGAVARLVSQPQKAYSNPAAYTYHEREFQRGIDEASNSVGQVRRRPLRVRPC
jgi:hypothetical protein